MQNVWFWRAISLAVIFVLSGCAGIIPIARADQNYSQQVFFENSLSPGSYFYSQGRVVPPAHCI